MSDPSRRLRSQVRRFENRRRPTATRYTDAFRAEVVPFARRRISEGTPVSRVAHDLGLRPRTLILWLGASPASKLRPVRVVHEPRSDSEVMSVSTDHRPVVVTAAGVRVEGLDLDGVVRLLRSLA